MSNSNDNENPTIRKRRKKGGKFFLPDKRLTRVATSSNIFGSINRDATL
jgi:hypothetical protein